MLKMELVSITQLAYRFSVQKVFKIFSLSNRLNFLSGQSEVFETKMKAVFILIVAFHVVLTQSKLFYINYYFFQ